jgi:hypothetical protein
MFEPCRYYTETDVYLPIEQHPDFKALKERHDQPPDYEGVFVRSGFIVTSFGTDFIRACVLPYEEREQPVLDE